MCPQSQAQLEEKRNTTCFRVRRKLDMSTKELAQVLGCAERSVRRWEAGKETEAMYDAIFNWLGLQLAELNQDEARAWGQRVKDTVTLESPTAGLRELLTTPERSGLIADFDRYARQLDDYGERKLADGIRQTASAGVREYDENCRNYLAALEEDRARVIEGIVAVKEFREILDDPQKRAGLAAGLQDPLVYKFFATQTLAALLLSPTDTPSFLRKRVEQDPAVWEALMEKLRAALITASSRAPKRRGRARQ